MEGTDIARIIKYALIGVVFAIVAFQRWLVDRKTRKTQETIDAFGLIELYRNVYTKAYTAEEEGFSEVEYMDATKKSETAFRIQMGGHLQQFFSFKQMSDAIAKRKTSSIYQADDILPGMIEAAKRKAAENVSQIKAGIRKGGPDGQVTTRRRRRRRRR